MATSVIDRQLTGTGCKSGGRVVAAIGTGLAGGADALGEILDSRPFEEDAAYDNEIYGPEVAHVGRNSRTITSSSG